ncbi:MAG: 50S ribosomal protein L19 [Planctomycetaceae bacterium]|nr:50S ribosomal protein L19 [Planctomycetales bacterium]MCB9923120.1 50S ribosomal protein L19 [Planctomycetaceae bacterium]
MSQEIMNLVEQSSLREEPLEFQIGDTVDVHTKILEGNKERIQIFSGTVIARSGGGAREMFTVRRIVAGEGVERKFPVHSPRIAKVEVKRSSVVRRAKLYFLRDRVGKAVRLKERRR